MRGPTVTTGAIEIHQKEKMQSTEKGIVLIEMKNPGGTTEAHQEKEKNPTQRERSTPGESGALRKK